jgi:PilZ domain
MLLSKENGTSQPTQERRTMRRFDMHLPAAIRVGDQALDELLTETQNVSARGIFFYLDRPVPEGTRIEVTMTFPPHVTLTDPVRVRFSARVVRVEAPLPVSRVGVAALIEEYEFLRSSSASDYLGKTQ